MSYNIKLVKLINGELVLGKMSEDGKTIKDPAILQTVPAQQGVQMMILPFGYPFDQEIDGEIETRHVLYEYKNCPKELETKYMEASSNLTLSTPGDLKNLNKFAQNAPGGISDLLKK